MGTQMENDNLEQRLQNNGKGNWKLLQEQEKKLTVGMSSN